MKHDRREIPIGLKVWSIDERFGERTTAEPDTLQHMYMNSIFTTGLRGEYNTTGNLGAPRINRIFIDRDDDGQFIFTSPYDYFITPVNKFLFTNTLSPITNISYDECGDRTNGEDHFKALFGVNAGKKLGMGFKFDYIYGRGYYQEQSTSHFNYSMYASYLGERYNAHFLFSTNHQKVTENGGITDDRYITHPESFTDNFRENEIPTVLQKNWNRNDNQHIFFSHRYNIGFNRKVKMTEDEIKARKFAIESQKENAANKAREDAKKNANRDGKSLDENEFEGRKSYAGRPDNAKIAGDEPAIDSDKTKNDRIAVSETRPDTLALKDKNDDKAESEWMKNEYVPVTSFIHTLKFDNYRRIYQAYDTPENYYANSYNVISKFQGDSIFDKTNHYALKNTFAIALLEGFNKWAKAGLKVFASSDLRHFTLPTEEVAAASYNEHNFSIGGQLIKKEGHTLHYDVTAETWITGEDAGQLKVDFKTDLNFRLFNDTIRLAANGYFYRLNPSFYYRHYHSKHFWWDNESLDKEIRTRIEGVFSLKRTRTTLRVAIDNIKNYTYLAQSYNITEDFSRTGTDVYTKQHSGNINIITGQLSQDFTLGPLNWETVLTYQKSSNESVIPVPTLNIYTNLYLKFKIAKVLSVDLGADLRYFSKYNTLDYSPALGRFVVQDNGAANVETGNYPYINAYANMHLKHTRFFVMMSHINADSGEYFLTPHYPTNGRILRFGVSWNFFN
ncbi:MAG: putative porin [Prevotella sp.]